MQSGWPVEPMFHQLKNKDFWRKDGDKNELEK